MTTQTFKIDSITWNDLSMDQVYDRINTAQSSVGAEYLRQVLGTLLLEEAPLKERSERADYFSSHEKERNTFRRIFKDLGKTKKLSLYDYIFRFQEIKPAGNGIHYLLILLLLAAIALIFIRPVIGIILLVVMFIINISTYFKYKAGIESYFMCFKYIIRMLRAASRISNQVLKSAPDGAETQSDPLAAPARSLRADVKALSSLKRGSWLLTNSVSGSLVDVIMDYVRMLFHVDIIRFNQMRALAVEQAETIDHLFCTLGEIETDICISMFRDSLDHWVRPAFATGSAQADRADSASAPRAEQADSASATHAARVPSLQVRGMYHPLTPTIVTNDIDAGRSVLLTGSNASGKSTFLKQLAINQIFAQTIMTCLADQFATGFFKVCSSMALSDNILGGESYFIVEIKSLKRIFDTIDDTQGAVPVMCFIDEVLRGTNTRERVAASSQILKKMSSMNALCFAATHDIELTELLKEDMDNYHFEEFVNGNDVAFDYKIKPGPATSRNAIRLMQAYGFDPAVTQAAYELASADPG